MTGKYYQDLLEQVARLADRAAAEILRIYERDFAVRNKPDGTPVTDADVLADRIICEGLIGLESDTPVISEEGEHWAHRTKGAQRYWLVDPLDGTRGFTSRNGDFVINIALVEDSEAILGVVHWPVRNASFRGAREVPAVRRDADGTVNKISVLKRSEHPLTVAVSRSRYNPRTRRFLEAIGPCTTVQRGSALKCCLVAEGQVDLYPAFSETWYWDTAAPQAVVEAAGGRLTDLELRPLRYDLTNGLRNPDFIAFGADQALWRNSLPTDDW